MENRREAHRLAGNVDPPAWARRNLRRHLAPGMRVLDVGCGPGMIAAEVARHVPDGEVVALDASEARIAAARRVLLAHGNASAVVAEPHALPFADGVFDLVHSRFLLEYLPEKQRAVDELARVCRTGGTVLLQDLEGQFVNNVPPDPDLRRDVQAALDLLAETGFDPHVGHKLRGMLERAGLAPAGLEIEPYHLIAGAVVPDERARWELKLELAAEALTRLGFEDAAGVAARFLAYLDREDTVTFSHVFTAWAVKTRPDCLAGPCRPTTKGTPR
jgi:SAM-dependent methyltransferase